VPKNKPITRGFGLTVTYSTKPTLCGNLNDALRLDVVSLASLRGFIVLLNDL